ncbi:MAG: metalloregulator ArsR/SmtB family transcription factor [Nitrospirota bacterium]
MFMQEMLEILKLLSDESRLRILMLLEKKELCVCQIMGVLNISQPLVSRNLSLLAKAGFLKDRREGKLMFYSVKKKLPLKHNLVLSVLKETLKDDKVALKDAASLKDCEEFQKITGKCGMETFRAYIEHKEKMKRRQKSVVGI